MRVLLSCKIILMLIGILKISKIEKIMKLWVLLMTLGCLSLSANSLAQRQRISLDLKDCTVMSLFQAIQQQTNLYFVYNQKNFAVKEGENFMKK